MVKKLIIRLVSTFGMLMAFTVASQGVALANPAKVIINTGFKPWNATATTAISDVNVNIRTVPIPNKVPINAAPYNVQKTPVDCSAGCHLGFSNFFGAHPITNDYSLVDGMANGYSQEIDNVISGGKLKEIALDDFAWCGAGTNGIQPGEFHFETSLSGNVNRSANGGTWRAYWKWSVNGADLGQIGSGTGTSIQAPANNGQETRVIFVYEENAPQPQPKYMTLKGTKTDEVNFAGGGPYSSALVSMDNGGKTDTSNPYSIGSVRADQAHTLTSAAVPGFTLTGYRKNGGALVASTIYSYGANEVGDGGSVTLDWVYRPTITGTLTTSCSSIGVSIIGPAGVTTQVVIDGENLGSGSSVTVPDKYKDGVTRVAHLSAVYHGQTFSDIDVKNHVCQNAATCGASTVTDAFKSGAGDISSGGVNVKIVMNNSGDSIWKNKNVPTGGWSTGQHRLVFSPAAAQYWTVDSDERGIPNGTIADNQSVSKSGSYTFNVLLKPKSGAITASSVPIEWGMAFVDPSGVLKEQFGLPYCKDSSTPTVTLRGDYAPWLRVQNGSTAALGVIKGQLNNVSADSSSSVRGTRKLLGTSQDINADTTYLVMAYVGGSRFCSSNAYVLGQGIDTSGCTNSFGPYKFGLQANQLASYYDNVSGIASAGSCTAYNVLRPPSRASERAAKIVLNKDPNTLSGAIGAPLPATAPAGTVGCPAFYQSSSNTIGTALALTSGRATLLYDGNFSINANITAAQPVNISYTQNGDLADLNVPSLGIIVKGDVFIGSNVTRLDTYIYATGRIYTCSDYPASTGTIPSELPAITAARVQKCSKRLVVNGGLYAASGFAFGRNFFEAKGVGVAKTDPAFDTQPVGTDNALPQGPYYGGPAEDIIGNGLSFLLTPPGFEAGVKDQYDRPMYLQGDFTPRF